MATTNTTLMDTRYKTIIRSIISGTNTDELILDASALVGKESGMTPVLNISKIFCT